MKAWTQSGIKPDEGISTLDRIITGGYEWAPIQDTLRIRVKAISKGETDEYRGSTIKEMRSFIQESLTLRQVLRIAAGVYDPLGLITPFRSGMKNLLKDTMASTSAGGQPKWDEPISQQLKERWVLKLHELSQIGDILYPRNTLPQDTKVSEHALICFCDAGKLARCQYVYLLSRISGNVNTEWHMQLIYAKTQVNDVKVSIPNSELDSLHQGAAILHKVGLALPHVKRRALATDSVVACLWVRNHTLTLSTFQRHRVMNLLRLSQMEDIYHVAGKNNIADIGTKTEEPIKAVLPDSPFHQGPEFLKKGLDAAIKQGQLKPIMEIIPDRDQIREVNDGLAAKCRMPWEYLISKPAETAESKEKKDTDCEDHNQEETKESSKAQKREEVQGTTRL